MKQRYVTCNECRGWYRSLCASGTNGHPSFFLGLTRCCAVALLAISCLPIAAQEIVAPLLAGQTELTVSLPEAATGVEVQVNQADAVVKGFPVKDANQANFTVTLKDALVAGAKVRIRVLENGVARPWSDEAKVFAKEAAAASVQKKPTLSFTPSQIDFSQVDPSKKTQPWGVPSDPQTVTVKNEGTEPVHFEPKISPGDSFKFSPMPDCQNPLPAGATCTLHIVYEPSGAWGAQKALVGSASDLVEGNLNNGACPEKNASGSTTNLDKLDKNAIGPGNTGRMSPSLMLGALQRDIFTKRDPVTKKRCEARFADGIDTLHADPLLSTTILTGIPEHWKHPFTRGVAGVDLSAPSSQTVKQAYFIEFDLLAPLGRKPFGKSDTDTDPLDSRFWAWFNPRITSVPQSANYSALSTINASGAFLDSLTKSGTVKDVAQGLDMSGGLEVALIKPHDGIGWWSEYPNTKARLAISLIGGLGLTTPFSTDKTDVISKVNQSICDAYNNATAHNFACVTPSGANSPVIQDPVTGANKPFIAFVTPDRSRFFRRFYTGVRLKTFFFNQDIKGDCSLSVKPTKSAKNEPDKNGKRETDPNARTISDPGADAGCRETPYDLFPGIIDLSFGKDEAVTGGHFNKWLFRVEASYPLPFVKGLHVFGSVYTGGKNQQKPPFNALTIQSPNNNSDNPIQSDATTFRFPTQPLSRDYFRLGVGVDLIQLFKKSSNGGQPAKGSSK